MIKTGYRAWHACSSSRVACLGDPVGVAPVQDVEVLPVSTVHHPPGWQASVISTRQGQNTGKGAHSSLQGDGPPPPPFSLLDLLLASVLLTFA